MENVGPALKSERQSEDLDTVAALFAKLNCQVCQVYCSCNQYGHITRNCLKKFKTMICEWCGVSRHNKENCDVEKYQRSYSAKLENTVRYM